VDRARVPVREMRTHSEEVQKRLAGQVEILYHRASLIRISIILAALSVLLAAVLIITLFLTALMRIESTLLIILLFISCMIALIFSLAAFIREIQLSLQALKLDLESSV
jgi:hypothetical protein